MPLDPRARRLLDMLALSGAKTATTADRRENFRKLMAMADRPGPGMALEDVVTDGGVLLRIYRPERARSALVYCHGGGLVAGSIETHDGLCRRLAAASGVAVVSVGYRLAPEAPFPASLDDARSALRWVHDHSIELNISRQHIALGGDSAGALLACLIATGDCPVPLRALLLLCPVVDLMNRNGSRATFAAGYLIDAETIARDMASCFGSNTPCPTPLAGDLSRCPPAIIQAAEFDPFRDEARQFASELEAHGVAVDFTCHEGMVHVFQGLPAFLPQAETALQQAGHQLAALMR